MNKEVTMHGSIAPDRWGRDHWSTFAYIETRVVDHKGVPERHHMRCSVKLHPGLVHQTPFSTLDGQKYPTILKGGERLPDHDDWSCADDLEAYGLIKQEGTGIHPVFVLTDLGKTVAAALRQRLAEHVIPGSAYDSFEVPPDAEREMYRHERQNRRVGV